LGAAGVRGCPGPQAQVSRAPPKTRCPMLFVATLFCCLQLFYSVPCESMHGSRLPQKGPHQGSSGDHRPKRSPRRCRRPVGPKSQRNLFKLDAAAPLTPAFQASGAPAPSTSSDVIVRRFYSSSGLDADIDHERRLREMVAGSSFSFLHSRKLHAARLKRLDTARQAVLSMNHT